MVQNTSPAFSIFDFSPYSLGAYTPECYVLMVAQIVSRLGGSFSIGQVRNALEFLVNEGHAYTAVDDNHFKSTDC